MAYNTNPRHSGPHVEAYSGRSMHSGPQPSTQSLGQSNSPISPEDSKDREIQQLRSEVKRLNLQTNEEAILVILSDKDKEILVLNQRIEGMYSTTENLNQTIDKLRERIQLIIDEKDFLSDRLHVVESRFCPKSEWSIDHIPDLDQLIVEYKRSIEQSPKDFQLQQILQNCEKLSKVVKCVFKSESSYLDAHITNPQMYQSDPSPSKPINLETSESGQYRSMFLSGQYYKSPTQTQLPQSSQLSSQPSNTQISQAGQYGPQPSNTQIPQSTQYGSQPSNTQILQAGQYGLQPSNTQISQAGQFGSQPSNYSQIPQAGQHGSQPSNYTQIPQSAQNQMNLPQLYQGNRLAQQPMDIQAHPQGQYAPRQPAPSSRPEMKQIHQTYIPRNPY